MDNGGFLRQLFAEKGRGAYWTVVYWLYVKLGLYFLFLPHRLLKYFIFLFPGFYPFINRWFWNRIGGEQYYKKVCTSTRHFVATTRLEKLLENAKFKNMLDVGCGTGNTLGHLKSRFPDGEFVGCDFSPKQIKEARGFKGIQFDVADAQRLPYQSNQFDVVITIGCLVHIPTQHIKKCIDEIQRVAKNYIIIFEEDSGLISEHLSYLWNRSGWFFYHDYKKLFDKCDIEYSGINRSREQELHPHIYKKRD